MHGTGDPVRRGCAQAQTRRRGGRADPPPPLETKNQLRPLPEMPRIFSFMVRIGIC